MHKKTPLLGAYLAKNPILAALLFFIDTCTFFLKRKPKKVFSPKKPPKKILLGNLGHLGDAVIATSVLPVLKKAFPQAEIGFLAGSWSQEVFKSHPLIHKIFLLDHWKLNRSEQGFFTKLKKYFSMRRQVLAQIKKEKYDLALDLYFYFPNSIPLLWQAKIPQRIGFASGGFRNFLTDFVFFENKNHYVSEYYLQLLKKAAVPPAYYSHLNICLKDANTDLGRLLPLEFEKKGYLVMHMGAGSELKKWPGEKWRKLAGRLIDEGFLLAFTGRGTKEKAAIFEITKKFSQTVNLCGQLDFAGLQSLIKNASAVISTDSLVSHLAGAYQIPLVVLFAGLNNFYHWTPPCDWTRPLVKNRASLTDSPCEITVEEVQQALAIILKKKKEAGKHFQPQKNQL